MRPAPLLAATLLLGAALLLHAPGVGAETDDDEARFPNEAYTAEFRTLVNESIDRAAHWLLRRQRADGSWEHPRSAQYPMGPTALATLALLKAGVPAEHPRVGRAFAHLRRLPMEHTYSVAVLLMALDAKYGPAQETFSEEEVDRYGNRRKRQPCEEHITKEDLAWMKEGVRFLLENQRDGAWRYPQGGWDLSNTQYALLGLKAASRCGVEIPARAWLAALEHLLAVQEKEGPEESVRVNEVRGDYRIEWMEKARARGFAYVPGSRPTGSMTTAGLAGLLICQSELWESRRFTGRLRQQTRDAVRDAFAWMQVHFDVRTNPHGPAVWHAYYLYGLERAGILGRVRFFGPHDWYLDGAQVLLSSQEEDGSWWRGDVVETCFGLLFLKRASFRTRNPALTPSDPAPAPDGGR